MRKELEFWQKSQEEKNSPKDTPETQIKKEEQTQETNQQQEDK